MLLIYEWNGLAVFLSEIFLLWFCFFNLHKMNWGVSFSVFWNNLYGLFFEKLIEFTNKLCFLCGKNIDQSFHSCFLFVLGWILVRFPPPEICAFHLRLQIHYHKSVQNSIFFIFFSIFCHGYSSFSVIIYIYFYIFVLRIR